MDSKCNEMLERIRQDILDQRENLDRMEFALLAAEDEMDQMRELRMREGRAWSDA